MQRNLPHIAGMALNAPLMLEPAYARVFFCALGSRLGVTRIADTGSGLVLDSEGMGRELALFGQDDKPSRPARGYQVNDRIAIIPVSGTLVNKASWLNTMSGFTGYDSLVTRLQQAVYDPEVDGVLLDMDTPGGMVAGAFDCADMIARLREQKPVWALANDMNCSAGQLLASACSRRLVTQTAKSGSIGVIMAHSNYEKALEMEGVDITLIYSGQHKTDGNETQALPASVRKDLQQKVDATRQMFAEKVAAYTGLTVQAVLDTEAAVFSGAQALEVGLADEVVINTDAVGVMREQISRSKTTIGTGATMKQGDTTTQTSTTQTLDATAVALPEAVTSSQPDPAAITAAVEAENQRIMGIMGCEEAAGREAMARELAATPGMSLATAQRILATAPQEAQARTSTALDSMMAKSPDAVSSGNASTGDADFDLLMNAPV